MSRFEYVRQSVENGEVILKKTVSPHVKNYDHNFPGVFEIANQLLTLHALFSAMKERQGVLYLKRELRWLPTVLTVCTPEGG